MIIIRGNSGVHLPTWKSKPTDLRYEEDKTSTAFNHLAAQKPVQLRQLSERITVYTQDAELFRSFLYKKWKAYQHHVNTLNQTFFHSVREASADLLQTGKITSEELCSFYAAVGNEKAWRGKIFPYEIRAQLIKDLGKDFYHDPDIKAEKIKDELTHPYWSQFAVSKRWIEARTRALENNQFPKEDQPAAFALLGFLQGVGPLRTPEEQVKCLVSFLENSTTDWQAHTHQREMEAKNHENNFNLLQAKLKEHDPQKAGLAPVLLGLVSGLEKVPTSHVLSSQSHAAQELSGQAEDFLAKEIKINHRTQKNLLGETSGVELKYLLRHSNNMKAINQLVNAHEAHGETRPNVMAFNAYRYYRFCTQDPIDET